MKDLTAKNLNDADRKQRNYLSERIQKKLFNSELFEHGSFVDQNRDVLEVAILKEAFEKKVFSHVMRDNQMNGIDTVKHEEGTILVLSAFKDYTIADLQQVISEMKTSAKSETK